MINPWMILGAIAFAALVGWQGYQMGYSASEDDHNAEMLARIEAGQKIERARVELARERDALRDQLKEQADADPIVEHQCFGPSRALRLNANR